MNNLLILSCKWYINTFKNLPIIVNIEVLSKSTASENKIMKKLKMIQV